MNDRPQGQDASDSTAVYSTEQRLVEALQSGEAQAAEKFVRDNVSWMVAAATRILKDRSQAEDCVQEAFIKAFRGIGAFEGRSRLRSWLHRILINETLTRVRVRQRQSESSLETFMPVFDANACRIEDPWQLPKTPDEIFESENRRMLIRSKIDQLPDDYRIVLQLRDIEEMTTQEAAEALGISVANVKVRLHRARSALKKLIEPLLAGDL